MVWRFARCAYETNEKQHICEKTVSSHICCFPLVLQAHLANRHTAVTARHQLHYTTPFTFAVTPFTFAVTPFTFAVTPFTFAALVGKRVVLWRRDDVPSPRSGRTFALVTPQSQPTQNCRGLPANYTHVFPEAVLVQQGARDVRLPANYSILACIYKEIRAVR